MAFHPVRIVLYFFFFAWSVALMGLTAYRINYTKQKDEPDILTTRTHFYTPIVAELLTVAILGTIFSLWMLFALFAKVGRGPVGTYGHEFLWLAILFIMSLVGAAIVTHEFSNLGWCRFTKVCRILEAIKALSWIFWGWTIFLMLGAIFNMMRNRHGITGPVHGRRDTYGSYPEARVAPETRNINQPGPITTQAAPTVAQTAPGYEQRAIA